MTSHLDSAGRPRMVDVGDKPATVREARAEGRLTCAAMTLALLDDNASPKGGVIRTAELAGIMAAKRTPDLIPLCHPLALAKVEVAIDPDPDLPGLRVAATVRAIGPTGVEMEALTAVSVACLTLFDMLKSVDRTMEIGGIAVVAKSGGRSGDWGRP